MTEYKNLIFTPNRLHMVPSNYVFPKEEHLYWQDHITVETKDLTLIG